MLNIVVLGQTCKGAGIIINHALSTQGVGPEGRFFPFTSLEAELTTLSTELIMERKTERISALPTTGLPRWLSWLRHSAHRPGRSVRRAGVQSPGRPVDFVFGFQGRML